MTEISLRAYCDEVRELIKAGSHDQAIAICQHILCLYPKYLEAYRLLGQACLKKGMHSEAQDLFNRVLSADPEDFIAHVGLSIIHEDKDLNEAIWRMERAFELAPDNAEVRKELRRLYARRDKVEKARLKPTRGGLGRIYAKGGHLQQAVEEFKAVLEEDEGRVDIQIALAEALWRKGQKLETSELCLSILEKLPNCLKANLIWGEIWFHSDDEGLKEEATARLAVAQALDPENAVAQELFGHLSPLPPQVREIPHLEVVAVAPEEAEELPTAAIPRITPVEDEALDWLRQMREQAPEPVAEEPEFEPMIAELETTEPVEAAEEIPDWLQQSREMLSEPSFEGVEEAPAEPQMIEEKPKEPVTLQPPEIEKEEEEIPDWLRELRGSMTEEPPAGEEMGLPMSEEEEEEIPDWLRQMREATIETQISEPSVPAELGAEEIEEIPIWLKEMREAMPEEAGIEEIETLAEEALTGKGAEPEREGTPSWLHIPHEEEVEEPTLEEAPTVEMPEAEAALAAEEEIPPWLRFLREQGLEEPTSEEAPAEEIVAEIEVPEAEVAPAEEEEIPAWLRTLREQGLEEPTLEEAPTEMVAKAEAPEAAPAEEETPAWLRILREQGLEEPTLEEAPAEEIVAEIEVPEAEAIPAEETVMAEETPTAEELPPAEPAEEIPDWLLRVMREEGVEPGLEEIPAVEVPKVEAAPAEEEEELPTWLRTLREEGLEEPPLEEAPAEEIVAEIAPVKKEEEIPSWLRILREEGLEEPTLKEAPAEEIVAETAPVRREEEIPAWLRILREEGLEEPTLEEAPAAEVVAEAEVLEAKAAPAEEEIPAWLRILQEEELEEAPTEQIVVEPVERPKVEKAPITAKAVAKEIPEKAVPLKAEPVEATYTIEECQAKLKTNPNDYQTRLNLARAYHKKGDREAAFAQYVKLINSGRLLEMVIGDLERTRQESPARSDVWQLLGDAYVKSGYLQKALESYRKALTRL